jgi:hypothetical protein
MMNFHRIGPALALFAIVSTIFFAVRAQDAGSSTASDVALIESNYGCDIGMQFWRRDSQATLCVPRCTSDVDCGSIYGRCRIVDFADPSPTPDVVFVDDLVPDDVATKMRGTDPNIPPIAMCDPFYDIPGATDSYGQ